MTVRILPIMMGLLAIACAPALAQTATETTEAAQQATEPAAEAKAPNRKEVNIEADQMEVLQNEKRAIFSGKVDATRGDVKLKADKLVVTYADAAQSDGSKKTDVTFLDATGNVLIVTARQRITGRTARMDVKANKVTVEGGVTVTQGQTVMRGPQLLVDLNTDTSRMSGGRVKGSFVPQ